MAKPSNIESTIATPDLEPSFHIHQLQKRHAYSVFDTFHREVKNGHVENGLNITGDAPATLKSVKSVASDPQLPHNARVEFYVAETDTAPPRRIMRFASFVKKFITRSPGGNHSVIGVVMVLPYRSIHGPNVVSCFYRAGSVNTVVGPASSYSAAYGLKVRGALLEHALLACRRSRSPYRTLVAELTYKESEVGMQQVVYTYEERGFMVMGRLEDVMEKEGVLYDRIMLQKQL